MLRAYKAKWIISCDDNDTVYENHALIVDEGEIIDILPENELEKYDLQKILNYGNAVITPGFVNMLSYLQSTDIGQKKENSLKFKLKSIFKKIQKSYIMAGVPKNSFALRLTNIAQEYFCWSRKTKLESFKHGIELSILNGITCVGQVSREKKYFEIINKVPIKTYVFFELFADSSEKGKYAYNEISKTIEKLMNNKADNTFIGVCLNSVCNVHKRLWRVLSKYCRKHNLLLMLHLAESQEEMDWLKHGFSDIDLYHKFIGLNKLTPYVKNVSHYKYLKDIDVLGKKVLIANANQLQKDELEKLAQEQVKFIYCPRYCDKVFAKKQNFSDIRKIFGENIGFGTDSLFNNYDLSVLNEAKYANKDLNLNVLDLLKYLTIYPAKILRLEHIIGSIKKTKHADFNVFSLNENEDYNAIISKKNPDYVYAKGRKIVKNGVLRLHLDID